MISSVILIAVLGVWNVGGLTEVWNRAVVGGRIFPPEYVKWLLNVVFGFFSDFHKMK